MNLGADAVSGKHRDVDLIDFRESLQPPANLHPIRQPRNRYVDHHGAKLVVTQEIGALPTLVEASCRPTTASAISSSSVSPGRATTVSGGLAGSMPTAAHLELERRRRGVRGAASPNPRGVASVDHQHVFAAIACRQSGERGRVPGDRPAPP